MKVPCPNCRQICQVDIPKTGCESLRAVCRHCSTGLVVTGKLRAGADYRGVAIYCSRCGKTQPFSDHCTSCNGRFESYLAVQAEQRTVKSHPPTATGPARAHQGARGSLRKRISAQQLAAGAGKWWLAAGLVSLAVALIAVLISSRANAERNYVTGYVEAVYGINCGFELSRNVCTRYSDQGKNSPESGAIKHIAGGEEKQSLLMVKSEVDGLMTRLAAHPKIYDASYAKIRQLYAVYEQQYKTVSGAMDSTSCNMQDVDGLKDEYASRLREIKRDLPGKLAEQFVISGRKYNLNFINNPGI